MAKPSPKKAPPPPAPSKAPREDRQSADVLLTMAAIVVAVWAGAAWLTPLLITAPLAFYIARGAGRQVAVHDALFRRWSITVLVMSMVVTGFAPPEAFAAIPFASVVTERVATWLTHGGNPPLGAGFMALSAAAFVVLTAASTGVAGALVFSAVLALNGAYATYLISQGYNVIEMALVAISPWQWCFLAGLVALYTPLAAFSRARLRGGGGKSFDWTRHRTRLIVGAALLAAAFLLRLTIAGPYTSLVRYWTIF